MPWMYKIIIILLIAWGLTTGLHRSTGVKGDVNLPKVAPIWPMGLHLDSMGIIEAN